MQCQSRSGQLAGGIVGKLGRLNKAEIIDQTRFLALFSSYRPEDGQTLPKISNRGFFPGESVTRGLESFKSVGEVLTK